MKYRDAMISAGRAYLYRTLSEAGGNMRKAAELAGVCRQTMYFLLQKHGLEVVKRNPTIKETEPLKKYPLRGTDRS